MTKPSSITHHSGSGQSRLYLKHLFSVPFKVALLPTVKKDIVSFDSNMQYYSELRYSSFSSSAIERSHRHHAPRISFTRRLCFFKRCEFHPRHGPWYWRPSWKSVGRGFDGWQSTHWARKCGAQLSARWHGEGRRGRGAWRPACVVALSPPFCRAGTSQLHQAIVGMVR